MASAPSFAPSPNQFAPKRGRPAHEDAGFDPTRIRLSGRHFNVGSLTVKFGLVEARVLSRSPSKIEVAVPAMDPGPCKIIVTTGGGSATSVEDFQVLPFPTLFDLDPFGFSRDPSGEDLIIVINGDAFIASVDELIADCHLTPRFNPDFEVGSETFRLEVVFVVPTAIAVRVPSIPNFDQFVGGHGRISILFSDGVFLESEAWEIKGL